VGTLLSMAVPFLTQALVDDGIGAGDVGVIAAVLLAQFAFFVGDYAMGFLRSRIVLRASTSVSIGLTGDFIAKMLRLPVTFFETKSVGDINQRIDDNSRIESFATSEAISVAFSLVTFVVYYIVIGMYSVRVMLVYTFFSAIGVGWMLFFQARRKVMDYKLFGLRAKNRSSLLGMMMGVQALKLSGASETKRKEWVALQARLYDARRESLVLEQKQSGGTESMSRIGGIVVTFLVALSVVDGSLTLGMMMSISYILGQLAAPLSQLVGFVRQLQDVRNSMERSEDVFSQKDEDEGLEDVRIPDGVPGFRLDGLSFRYGSSVSRSVLSDVSFDIPAGKTTAIVGESGSGKSTLLKLLLKFYAPESGSVSMLGGDLSAYPAAEVRSRCGAVLQDAYVFDDTISGNITMGLPLDGERMEKVLWVSCLDKLVESLPLGINTMVGESGMGLSGGERQRMMLARAIYAEHDCLILDEPTSSLDAATEHTLMERLAGFMEGKTMVVAAHRLSTVRDADQIVVLDGGRVVERGDHDSLVSQHGRYQELVSRQM